MKGILPNRETLVYKEVGDCRIHADVYRPAGSGAGSPVVVFIHGGALIEGSREWANAEFMRLLCDAGCTVAAIDYRLAPETRLPEIVADVRDALRWVRERGPALFGVDPSRLAVTGSSAGGYLALMTGTFEEPPAALVSFYGYGDIVGDWYTRPDPYYSSRPAIPEETARAEVGEKPISEAGEGRENFYLYCRQHGIWPVEVAGVDPAADPAFFEPYCPVRNVTADYPPTLLLHGDADTDVPYEQSVMMAEALSSAGIEHELITIRGGPHSFDADTEKPAVKAAFKSVLEFLGKHLAP